MREGLANVGDVLAGKYRVDRILGIGGMGMVVSATHLDLDQSVAIKFMLPAAMESAEAKQRFMREARAAGRLTSEHVCRVSDVGQFESGQPYIVMEFLQGQDLGTLLKRKGPLPVLTAVDYILQAAEGMAEAHAHGIVHRDLKPDNLFLANRVDGSQVIKVLDFGISKAHVTGIATKTGDIMGSPAYMAPEQMQSTRDVDERADIWSLGVILYQLISGRMPFVADTLPALCLAVIHDAPPSLASIRQDLPSGLAEVVMKCLAKDKNGRYGSVLELAKALSPYADEDSVGAVTRIRSMLQRKRPPTAPPLMMLPSEFSDVVAPTLMSTSGSLEITAPPLATGSSISSTAPRDNAVTTMSSSAGESMSLIEQRRLPMGLIGAIAGGIGLVALIIVMVMMKKSADEDAPKPATAPGPTANTQAPPSEAATPPPAPPPTEQAKQTEPKVEPIEEAPPKPNENVTVVDDGATPPPAQQTTAPANPPATSGQKKGTTAGGTKKKDPKDTKKDAKDPKDQTAKNAGSGATTPPPQPPQPPAPPTGDGSDDDDKWLHMHHDGQKPKK
jgi:eukaryotic-like serine/threonine-protein kinase